MKAALCTRYGPPEVVRIGDIPKPKPKSGEVLIKVIATTVHYGDTRIRDFKVPWQVWIPSRLYLGIFRPRRPVFGFELAGIVEALGDGVSNYAVGDEVFAQTLNHGFGAHAEYKCLPADSKMLARKPANATFAEAAAVPTGATTALRVLRNVDIGPGMNVLVYGASGSVGTNAVQLARHYGARVTGVTSAKNLDLVRSLGADATIDYQADDVAERPERYDVVFDAVGKLERGKAERILKPGGRALSVLKGPYPEKDDDLVFIRDLMEKGELRAVVERTYPLADIVAAHRHVGAGHKVGAVVIVVDPDLAFEQTARKVE